MISVLIVTLDEKENAWVEKEAVYNAWGDEIWGNPALKICSKYQNQSKSSTIAIWESSAPSICLKTPVKKLENSKKDREIWKNLPLQA